VWEANQVSFEVLLGFFYFFIFFGEGRLDGCCFMRCFEAVCWFDVSSIPPPPGAQTNQKQRWAGGFLGCFSCKGWV
jgi:hypothetical protein